MLIYLQISTAITNRDDGIINRETFFSCVCVVSIYVYIFRVYVSHSHPSISPEVGSQPPGGHRMYNDIVILVTHMTYYLHITYAHPLVYFKSSLDYL